MYSGLCLLSNMFSTDIPVNEKFTLNTMKSGIMISLQHKSNLTENRNAMNVCHNSKDHIETQH